MEWEQLTAEVLEKLLHSARRVLVYKRQDGYDENWNFCDNEPGPFEAVHILSSMCEPLSEDEHFFLWDEEDGWNYSSGEALAAFSHYCVITSPYPIRKPSTIIK